LDGRGEHGETVGRTQCGMGGSDKTARTSRSMRMHLQKMVSEMFPSVFALPALVPVAPFAGSDASVFTPQRDTTTLIREIDSLIGELLLGKRKKDVEEEEELDDEEEEEEPPKRKRGRPPGKLPGKKAGRRSREDDDDE